MGAAVHRCDLPRDGREAGDAIAGQARSHAHLQGKKLRRLT
ncbi:hypothetical protein SAMN05216230_102411 [Pseudomonas soli]|uniref:Uncharacterized protein n=1 Tax=Pseudomonas soli TaxID=1306993 RepID=A0A1H9F2W5_9PSED|nr:hypothetical protein SAMN05216230_102411 [Pseudomonas soli]